MTSKFCMQLPCLLSCGLGLAEGTIWLATFLQFSGDYALLVYPSTLSISVNTSLQLSFVRAFPREQTGKWKWSLRCQRDSHPPGHMEGHPCCLLSPLYWFGSCKLVNMYTMRKGWPEDRKQGEQPMRILNTGGMHNSFLSVEEFQKWCKRSTN